MEGSILDDLRALLVPPRQGTPGAIPLFCFPHAGGTPTLFFKWQEGLKGQANVICVQAPGRNMRFREKPHTSLHLIVDEVVEALRIYSGSPFAFFGHSLGGLISFEVARELRRRGKPGPAHLFVSASRPPDHAMVYPLLHELSDREFLKEMQGRYAGIPAAVYENRELMEMFLPVLRADMTAYETHTHVEEAPLDCPISMFTGAEDALVTEQVAVNWARQTTAKFELRIFPGGHFFLNENRARVLDVIGRKLVEHQDRGSGRNVVLAGMAEGFK